MFVWVHMCGVCVCVCVCVCVHCLCLCLPVCMFCGVGCVSVFVSVCVHACCVCVLWCWVCLWVSVFVLALVCVVCDTVSMSVNVCMPACQCVYTLCCALQSGWLLWSHADFPEAGASACFTADWRRPQAAGTDVAGNHSLLVCVSVRCMPPPTHTHTNTHTEEIIKRGTYFITLCVYAFCWIGCIVCGFALCMYSFIHSTVRECVWRLCLCVCVCRELGVC